MVIAQMFVDNVSIHAAYKVDSEMNHVSTYKNSSIIYINCHKLATTS